MRPARNKHPRGKRAVQNENHGRLRGRGLWGRFDLELRRWTALCAVVLGHPHHPALAVRDGLLERLMRGQRTAKMLADERFVRALVAASPARAAVPEGTVRPALRVVCDA